MQVNQNKHINICFTVDDIFIDPMLICLYSIIEKMNKDYKITLYIISEKKLDVVVEEKYKKFINRITCINIQDHKILLQSLPIGKNWNYIVYARLLIPYIIKCNKIIYLDSDLLFLRDISTLWNESVEKSYLGAVKDSALFYLDGIRENFDSDIKFCFNASVMILNNKLIRQNFSLNDFITFIVSNKDNLMLNEMDALNVLLYKKIKFIDPRWNVRNMLRVVKSVKYTCYTNTEYFNSINDPYVIHFDGAMKPWQSDTFPSKWVIEYRKYMKAAGVRLTKLPTASILRRFCLGNIYLSLKKLPDPIYKFIISKKFIKI